MIQLKPNKDESSDDFMKRCVAELADIGVEFKDAQDACSLVATHVPTGGIDAH